MNAPIALEEKVGQLITVGFHGTKVGDPGVEKVMRDIETGAIGGVILFRYNIEGPDQLRTLLAALKAVPTKYPLIVMLDQEGGLVQRIRKNNGFTDFLSAKKIAEQMTPEEAVHHYREMARIIRETGFNFNCAPCVDLDCDPPCEAIGKLERSYGSDPATVVAYASALIEAMRAEGVLTSLKHFPGHGRAIGDSHMGLVDITKTWSEEELEPYRTLISTGRVDTVMTAHLVHADIDKDLPATFSEQWVNRLRLDLKHDGVIVSDDLHMGAILQHFTFHEIVLNSLRAGLDLLVFSNNPLASQSQGIRFASSKNSVDGDVSVPDVEIPQRVFEEVHSLIASGTLSQELIHSAFTRVTRLKLRLQ